MWTKVAHTKYLMTYILYAIEFVTQKTYFIPLQSTQEAHIVRALDILKNRRWTFNTIILDDHPSHRVISNTSSEITEIDPDLTQKQKTGFLFDFLKTQTVNSLADYEMKISIVSSENHSKLGYAENSVYHLKQIAAYLFKSNISDNIF